MGMEWGWGHVEASVVGLGVLPSPCRGRELEERLHLL